MNRTIKILISLITLAYFMGEYFPQHNTLAMNLIYILSATLVIHIIKSTNLVHRVFHKSSRVTYGLFRIDCITNTYNAAEGDSYSVMYCKICDSCKHRVIGEKLFKIKGTVLRDSALGYTKDKILDMFRTNTFKE
jgi:hypothetical protein